MLGRPMRSASADAGLSWALLAVDDTPVCTFREGPICVHAPYDALRRPTALKVQEGAGVTATRTHEKLLYGEASGAPTGAGTYHKGRVWRTWDGAGLVEVKAYDFKGHAVEVDRQLIALVDVDETVDWDATPGSGIAALETGATFTTEQSFDALDRVVTSTTPDGSITSYAYNVAGLLESVGVTLPGASTSTSLVSDIDYDEKGRRTKIVYGNGTTTEHSYDPLTFRLTRLKTTRASDSAVLQDLLYTYDAVGNIVEVRDDAQQTEFFANAVVSPTQKFEYDALYRLVNAKGRQKQTMSGIPDHADPSKGGIPDGTPEVPGAMSSYERRYSYDGVGNITEMKQVSAWTRTYAYAADSNRLSSTSESGGTKSYRYNARGAMTSMAHLDLASTGLDDPMVSDFRDQLAQVTLNSSGETARFHYDPTRERVRKVWKKGAITEERIYLGGWELWRKWNGSTLTDERETLHVLDGESRIAMVETLTVGGGSSTPVLRFQLGNHLGSACLELDDSGELLTYEEYFPYGSTSWWAERSASPVSHKRYRYIGKEKDEETGLHYHSARYYAGWLGRWTSSDPAGLVDGVGRYSYVGGRPVGSMDGIGYSASDAVCLPDETVEFDWQSHRPSTSPMPKSTEIDITKSMRDLIETYQGSHFGDSYDPRIWEGGRFAEQSDVEQPAPQDVTLRVREGIPATVALDAMLHPTAPDMPMVDCATAVTLAVYDALQSELGAREFDDLFAGMELGLDVTPEADTPLEVMFVRQEVGYREFVDQYEQDLSDGTLVRFSNDPRYEILAGDNNFWSGEWTVFDEEQQAYLGHPFTSALTREEIVDQLRANYPIDTRVKADEIRASDPRDPLLSDPWTQGNVTIYRLRPDAMQRLRAYNQNKGRP